jgi:hypothetical protein
VLLPASAVAWRAHHGRVDVLAAGVDLLLHVLVRLESGLLECGLDRALADDEQAGLTGVDQFPELLDVGAGQALPQVATNSADGAANGRGREDRGREQQPDERASGDTAPRPVPGGRFVVVDVSDRPGIACICRSDESSLPRLTTPAGTSNPAR